MEVYTGIYWYILAYTLIWIPVDFQMQHRQDLRLWPPALARLTRRGQAQRRHGETAAAQSSGTSGLGDWVRGGTERLPQQAQHQLAR